MPSSGTLVASQFDMERSSLLSPVIQQGAMWLSRVFHPFIISVSVLFIAQLFQGYAWFGAAAWTALCFMVVIVPVLLFILLRVRSGRYQDADVSVREDRYLLYALAGGCFILLVALLAFLQAPTIVQQTLQAALFAVAVGALFNRYVNKLSLHTLTVAGCAAVFLFVRPSAGITLGLVSLLVGWSRVYLTRHTLAEVIWGWVVGVLCVAIWFLTRPFAV